MNFLRRFTRLEVAVNQMLIRQAMREAIAILQPKGGRDTKTLEMHVLEDLRLGVLFEGGLTEIAYKLISYGIFKLLETCLFFFFLFSDITLHRV